MPPAYFPFKKIFMENQIQQEELFDVEIDATAKSLINDIATWAKIVAVSAFVSYGLSLVVAVMSKSEIESGFAASAGKASQIASALVGAVIGVIINIFLFKFAVEAKHGVEHMDQGRLESGFNNLRIYVKILGILLIIALVFFVLALLVALLGRGI
jgi:hypothetical protein